MKTKDLVIQGMSCGHCVMSVRKELTKLPGVQVEMLEVGKGRVQYDEARVTPADLAQAIERAGYQLVTG